MQTAPKVRRVIRGESESGRELGDLGWRCRGRRHLACWREAVTGRRRQWRYGGLWEEPAEEQALLGSKLNCQLVWDELPVHLLLLPLHGLPLLRLKQPPGPKQETLYWLHQGL